MGKYMIYFLYLQIFSRIFLSQPYYLTNQAEDCRKNGYIFLARSFFLPDQQGNNQYDKQSGKEKRNCKYQISFFLKTGILLVVRF